MKMPVEMPDSLGKLMEALDECGVAQRNTKLAKDDGFKADFDKWEGCKLFHNQFEVPQDDRAAANEEWRTFMRISSMQLFNYINDFAQGKRRIVWRITPEVSEMPEYDPITSVVTGRMFGHFYCRLWIEDIADDNA